MSSRVLPKTRKRRFGLVRRIYELLEGDGFTQLEADEYLSGETEMQVETAQRWRRHDSMPMGSQWSKLEEIYVSLAAEASTNGERPVAVRKKVKPEARAPEADPRPTPKQIRLPMNESGVDLVEEMMNGVVGLMNREQKILLWNKLSIQLMAAS